MPNDLTEPPSDCFEDTFWEVIGDTKNVSEVWFKHAWNKIFRKEKA